jgi:hypothetical protein
MTQITKAQSADTPQCPSHAEQREQISGISTQPARAWQHMLQWRDVTMSPKRLCALTIKIFKIASHTRTYENIAAI